MARVWVGIGSNIEPAANVHAAVAALRDRFGELLISTVYRTEAVGFEGRPFLNLVVGFDTDDTPGEVFAFLRATEDASGRVRTGPKFAARTLDLDLLSYGGSCGEVAGKPLPHPDILAYPFVLGPLAELAPTERHPQAGQTYAALWRDMRERGGAEGMEPVAIDGLRARS